MADNIQGVLKLYAQNFYMNTNNRRRKNKPQNKRSGAPSGGRRNGNQRPRGRKASTLDPSLFIKRAVEAEEVIYEPSRSIDQLPVHHELVNRLIKKGFKLPTEIQDKTLEDILAGKDLVGIAQTGTGKTGAFLIPIIEQLLKSHKKSEHALIVVPTRELALQVSEEFKSMTNGLRLFSSVFIGGTNIKRDIQTLRRYSHVVIGTPGRLIDLKKRGALGFSRFNMLVLDEFDRMLDMGFSRDMDTIIDEMRNREQTVLFSATLDKSQQERVNNILRNPVHVKISSGNTSADQVDQDIIRMSNNEDKFNKLCSMLSQDEFARVLVFDETKRRVNQLCKKLNNQGIKSDQIQGNKSQAARQRALKAFKTGKIRVLVATDVAARGIDVSDVTHVINYQMPQTYDSYIHRIGRTGRAGKTGKAFTFVG